MKNKYVVLFLLGLIGLYFIVKSLADSLYFSHPDRIQIVRYGKDTVIYSLGLSDQVNYAMRFDPDLRVAVPGGYGAYRVGGLGKLIELEKKPSLFQNAFSFASSSMIDYYFYPPGQPEIYYGGGESSWKDEILDNIWFILKSNSNANLIDRVYIYGKFLGKSKNDFSYLDIDVNKVSGSRLFDNKDFYKTYQGYFYQPTFRQEKKNVQIFYWEDYSAADQLAQVLEGSGIRVVDISQGKKASTCLVTERGKEISKTSLKIGGFLGCKVQNGKTEISDIILVLGPSEKNWR